MNFETVTDNKKAVHSDAEVLQLTNLLNEQTSVLDEGFDEQFDQFLAVNGRSVVKPSAVCGDPHIDIAAYNLARSRFDAFGRRTGCARSLRKSNIFDLFRRINHPLRFPVNP